MDIESILAPEVQEYINAHCSDDMLALLLKKSPFPRVSMSEIVQQIKGKKVAQKKFPFLKQSGIVFPVGLSLEQSSSEATAHYKASLVKGNSMADLTCGFGIDAWFISQNFETVTLVEQNTELSSIVRHNWKILGKKADFKNMNLNEFLSKNKNYFQLIYLDPARRDEGRNKVFLLEELSPNLLSIQDCLLERADQILVKLSPLLDISYLISVLKHLFEIHIVAVKNEVKEILVRLCAGITEGNVFIKCINLESGEPSFEFRVEEVATSVSPYAEPLKYLYIPNNAVLKSGAYNEVSQRFGLFKLHPNTHFYTAEYRVENFPGRILEVKLAEAKDLHKGERFNIISKNHPLSPEMIKRKYKIKDGGRDYLIFTQSRRGKIILKSV